MPKIFGAIPVAKDAAKVERVFTRPIIPAAETSQTERQPEPDLAGASPLYSGILATDVGQALADAAGEAGAGEPPPAAESVTELMPEQARTPADLDPTPPIGDGDKVAVMDFLLLKAALETAIARIDEIEVRTNELETFVKRFSSLLPK